MSGEVDYPAAVLGAIAAAALWTVLVKNKAKRVGGAQTERGLPPAPTTDHPVLPGSARPDENEVLDVVPGEYPPCADLIDTPPVTAVKSYW